MYATNRKILTLQGQSWGMLTRAATSGLESLEWLRQEEPFDIAILDMQMPQMDGLTLAAEIRQQPNYQKLPLIMLTSMGRQETALRSEPVNFAAFLNKPVKQSQLYNELLQIFSEQPLKVAPSPNPSPKVDSQLAQVRPLLILLAEDNVVNQKVAMQGDREACIHAGMDDYVSKPIQVEELVQALSKGQTKREGCPF